jgi:hypothetical protein
MNAPLPMDVSGFLPNYADSPIMPRHACAWRWVWPFMIAVSA